jgi:hypothetical protein
MDKLLKFISNDEWFGKVFQCPKCEDDSIFEGFKYCPNCGYFVGNFIIKED